MWSMIRFYNTKLSVKKKFIIAMMGILFVAIPVLSVVFINSSHSLMIQAIEDRAELLNGNFSIIVKNAMNENSFTFLQQLILEVSDKDKILTGFVVANANNTIVASSNSDAYPIFGDIFNISLEQNSSDNRKNFTKQYARVQSMINKRVKAIRRLPEEQLLESIHFIYADPQSDDNNVVRAQANVSTDGKSNRQLIGYIFLALTTSYLDNEVSNLWIYSIVFMIFFLLLAFVGSYYLGSQMTNPIAVLAEKVRSYASGNLNEPIHSNRQDEIGSLIHDVEKMRCSIKESTDFLEIKVKERTRQLEAINKELESFSYSVSHDLRSPLRSIDGFSQAIFEDYYDKLDDNGKDFLMRIRAASQRMGELIDDILNLSRLTRSDMNFQNFDLSVTAGEVFEELRERDINRKIEVIVQKGIIVNGDRSLLKIVLENLIGNAWKYSSKKTDSVIEFGELKIAGESVFYVRDNGAGFKMEYAAKLFTPFQRLHTSNEFEGTGIGLATVQRIINRHGGRIWGEGEEGEGAVFFFTLENQI